jgi:hypothetical protein
MELLKDEEKVFITDGNRTPDVIAHDIWSKIKHEFVETPTT